VHFSRQYPDDHRSQDRRSLTQLRSRVFVGSPIPFPKHLREIDLDRLVESSSKWNARNYSPSARSVSRQGSARHDLPEFIGISSPARLTGARNSFADAKTGCSRAIERPRGRFFFRITAWNHLSPRNRLFGNAASISSLNPHGRTIGSALWEPLSGRVADGTCCLCRGKARHEERNDHQCSPTGGEPHRHP